MNEKKEPRQGIKALFNEKVAPFFEKVGALSRKQRLLICVLTLALIGGGYYYFFLTPRLESIQRLTQEHERLSGQLASFKRKAASLEKYEAELKSMEDEFYTALLALPDKKEIPSLLRAISNSGNDAGLEFLLFKPESEVKKDFYAEIPVSIKVSGGYHQIAEFFDRVSQLSRLVNIQDIVMNYAAKDALLTVSCKALTYMFVEKPETDQPKGTKNSKRGKRGRRK